jgi:hypothetical protein
MTDTCEKHCEATAFKIVIRGLEVEVARLKERLSDPMREVQRLGQEIEQERNFCPRCGKRTKDMTQVHTCTPPKD